MLALRLEQGRREGGEVDRLQKRATVGWQGRQSGRPPSHEQGINIREKISQWEGRSQQGNSQDAGVKAHPPTVSRSLSGDLLGNGCSNEGSRGGLHAKANLSKAESLGLDFRESPTQAGHGVVGRKSEPLQKCSTEISTTSPGNKLAAQIFACPKVEANKVNSTSKQTFTTNGNQTMDRILDVEVVSKPLPLSTDYQEDNMPAGNFYTSRGFWRKLEGDRLLWEKGRESSGEAQPPPKPQRTFQYRGANNNNSGHTMQWDIRSHHNNRKETSGTESDPEDNTKAGSRRSVYIQSTLKRRPGYRTLERDLIQLQQQQLFQIFVVVSLRKGSPGNTYSPEITQQFPKMFEKSSRLSREAEDQLKVIPKFCFPDSQDWKPSAHMPSETFSFVLTGEDGSRWFCYCRKILPSGKGKRLPEVHCIVSKLGCFNLFAKILEEVERRREISPALVYPFMRSVMEAPFPAPGRTVTVKSFLPGSGSEVLTLCRPVDSRLEHVDFDSLLQCLSVGKLLQVFASLLLERRVIFIADKLSVLSRCAHAALALLYPFTWQHTFVPVLPASMLDISCSPTPFLIGVLAPCLPELLELPIEEVLIVDLCADKFVVQLGDEDCILPSKLQAALQQILEEREEILRQEDGDRCGDQQADLSSLVSEGFVRFFVELVGHYPFHMVESSSGNRELQRDSFRKSHPSRGVRQFLQLFMDTQMFAGFIQDKELRKGGGRGLFEVRVAEYLDSYPEPEPSGVNKFLKGLGNKMKLLQIK
ncbi:DENN domain-containing protein 2C [Lates japonicus]|uniref:DENN domain-containing protein 2C n=1 Tax=Lates japonicus TaxID=270547 RepID=A0AAD3QW67_LATJO|nr:DENN domain-containing protein 2C [Lates japonicus]